jgi:arylsulfatase A-like enzyme
MKPGVQRFVLFLICALCGVARGAEKPNVVLILADDLGYGDVRCYNPERGKIATPHIDALAGQGMRFTDAHTSSGVCSPTRYSLLTGRCHWRTRLQSGIVGYLEEPLIPPGRLTIAGLLKQQGYGTAAVGKWHLGWDFQLTPDERKLLKSYGGKAGGGGEVKSTAGDGDRAAWHTIYSRPFRGGPVTAGFDSYFGTDVPNWPPYCFIENDRTVGIPSELLPAAVLQRNQASLQGPALPGWKLEEVLPALTERACAFITGAAKKSEPFFLYLPLTAPHTPIAVSPEWRGKSGLSDYADFVMQTDATVGRVLEALEKSGAAKNTLVLFTSDNGCAPYAGAKEMEAKGHFPSGPWRGYKADAWEGGHRVPFIVRWPGVVAAGTRCDALVQQSDVLATLAEALQVKLPGGAGEDSVSLLSLLRGGTAAVREFAISHASSGLPALRKGAWKIIFGPGGGGLQKASTGGAGQLYHLADDPAESKNLWAEQPALVAGLTADMERLVNTHPNDVPVKWRRFLRPAATTEEPSVPFTPSADAAGDWAVAVDEKLPNVLLLGDSISIGYTRGVRKALLGRANVFRPMQASEKRPDNCGDTTIGLKSIDRWLGSRRWDVIHFNWGLWDLCYRNPASKSQGGRDKVNGKVSTALEDYERQLEQLVVRLKATGARLIWASTTFVPAGEAGRIQGDDVKYNAIAARVMSRHGIEVNDLHALTSSFEPALFVKAGDVHFTPEGSQRIAAQVADKVSAALPKPAAANSR